jgi:hypothetical protein
MFNRQCDAIEQQGFMVPNWGLFVACCWNRMEFSFSWRSLDA